MVMLMVRARRPLFITWEKGGRGKGEENLFYTNLLIASALHYLLLIH